MANFYLRYKYYLITRATSDELATGIKPLVFAVNCKTMPKIDPAQHTSGNIPVTHQATHTAVMYAGASSGISSEIVHRIRGEPLTRETERAKLPIEHTIPLSAIVNEYAGHNTSSRQALDFQTHISAAVMLKAFLPVIDKEFLLTAEVGANVAELLKSGVGFVIDERMSATAGVAGFVAFGGRITGNSETAFGWGTAELLKAQGADENPVYVLPATELLSAANTNIFQCGIAETTEISVALFKRTKLSDLDQQPLAALSVTPIRALNLTEINE